jgi:hypothetical protein
MCRNIKPLFNFEPPTNDEEIRLAAIQFAKKISGFGKVSAVNEEAFELAIDEITESLGKFLASLSTSAPPKNREVEIEKSRIRNKVRFGK